MQSVGETGKQREKEVKGQEKIFTMKVIKHLLIQ